MYIQRHTIQKMTNLTLSRLSIPYTLSCSTQMSPAKHNCIDARSKAAVWTVDDVARLIEILKKEILFIHLFITFGST